eukprot:scaffold99231_cov75-Phaeocystis_antarctica.AAC.3
MGVSRAAQSCQRRHEVPNSGTAGRGRFDHTAAPLSIGGSARLSSVDSPDASAQPPGADRATARARARARARASGVALVASGA